MKNVQDLLNEARARCTPQTDMALAARLGVVRSGVSNWRNGRALPDAVACEKLAEISGIPLHRVLGIVGEARAISAAEKKVWRKLAAALFVGLLVTLPVSAQPILPTSGHAETPSAMGIMRKLRRIARQVASSLANLIRGESDGATALLA